ncbi:hypothetical protein [Chromobacterium paludis]|uniref:Uncharacterized protein n=1 Tax=Chromobacterium paludis TaxID=2605945 RepID=A0A5C1DG49_9NEIS|nr:hypothetical protein [Chromobacterium paludis]QEL55690.1 hypothetical protein FYK34_08965 [Chromobacterium paludis]
MKSGHGDPKPSHPSNLLHYWFQKLHGDRLAERDRSRFQAVEEEVLLNLMIIACILALALFTYLRR